MHVAWQINMRNKHEETEVCVQLQGCSLAGITEMWWDMTGVLPWRDRGSLGRPVWEDEVELHSICCHTKGIDLFLVTDDGPTESLWVRIKEQSNVGDIVMGVFQAA